MWLRLRCCGVSSSPEGRLLSLFGCLCVFVCLFTPADAMIRDTSGKTTSTSRTPAGQLAAHREAGVRLKKKKNSLKNSLLCKPRRTARRWSGRRYPLHVHRVYGAGATEAMLKCGLFHQSVVVVLLSLALVLALGYLRTSEPLRARSAAFCERAMSSRVTVAARVKLAVVIADLWHRVLLTKRDNKRTGDAMWQDAERHVCTQGH